MELADAVRQDIGFRHSFESLKDHEYVNSFISDQMLQCLMHKEKKDKNVTNWNPLDSILLVMMFSVVCLYLYFSILFSY